MQKAAHAPKEIFAAAKRLHLFRRENTGFDRGRPDLLSENVFRQPLQGMEVAQAAFAILDIGFDTIAAFANAAHAIIAFGHLRVDELPRRSLDDFGTESIFKLGKKLRVAE